MKISTPIMETFALKKVDILNLFLGSPEMLISLYRYMPKIMKIMDGMSLKMQDKAKKLTTFEFIPSDVSQSKSSSVF